MSDETTGQLLEQFVAALNGNIFLREFAVSSGRLAVPEGEIEVSDTMVILRNLVLVYQLKERNPEAETTQTALDKWFRKKVSGQAVHQIAASLGYLRDHAGRVVPNDRGHNLTLQTPAAGVVASLVIYCATAAPRFRGPKGRHSSQAGFVHFIEASDYFRVCAVLRTPIEFADYLSFREIVLRDTDASGLGISEAALLGQFLIEASGPPDEKYAGAFDHLVDVGEDSDLSYILHNLGDRVDHRSGNETETSHYAILQELALLSRSGLAAFKDRLKLCIDTVRRGEFRKATHFANPATDCGFLLTPWDPALGAPQEDYLRVLGQLSKYSFGVRRQVGVSVSRLPDGFYILWCYIDAPHVADPALDAALAAEDCPLPPTATRSIPRYHFDTEGLRGLVSPGDP